VAATIVRWCAEGTVALGAHEHAGVRWFRAEGLEALADVAALLGRWQLPTGGNASAWRAWRRSLEASARAAGYDLDAWCERARSAAAAARGGKGAEATAKAAGATPKGAKAKGTGGKATGAKGGPDAERRAARERATNDDARAKRARGTPKKTKKAPKG
jgi:hypothetical protein